MLRLGHYRHLRKLSMSFTFCSSVSLQMGSTFNILKPPKTLPLTHVPPILPCFLSSRKRHLYHTFKRLSPVLCSKPSSETNPSFLQTNGFSHATLPASVNGADMDLRNLRLEILRRRLEDLDIVLEKFTPGQHTHLLCPKCKGGDSEEKSLSLLIQEDGTAATWICFRAKCGWTAGTRPFAGSKSTYQSSNQVTKRQKREITTDSLGLEQLCGELVGYFSERLISADTLKRNCVMQKNWNNQIVIAFTYWRNGELVSCKYRDINKIFWQEKDTQKVFYGLDDIRGAEDIIIVEGEIDKLSMEEAGFRNCVSVPDGAPPSVSSKDLPAEEKDTKYQYLWNCKDYLQKASRIILATDGDKPGQALAEELARRLGKERCWRVRWPKKNENEYFKDANEVLMYLGPEALREVVERAELYPISGLFNFRQYFDDIDAFYHKSDGYELGVSTGWSALNPLYNVVPGELTIVTGVPNSGKSEWIDALLCNLNASVGWKFALCSMENKVRDHARKLLEKRIKKPFFDIRYGESVERMSVDEFEQGKEWLNDTFYLIRTETEYVSQMLTLVKRFAQHHSCHVWFVAHPRQLHNWIGGPPNLYDISGSAHFINKCDNGIVIHRNRDLSAGPMDQVQVCVRKVRNKVAGTIGEVFLSYNRVTGEFSDCQPPRRES